MSRKRFEENPILPVFCARLHEEEKSTATVERYCRSVRDFLVFCGDRPLTKKTVMDYRARLEERHADGGINGEISALNRLFSFLNRPDLRLRHLRRQTELFRSDTRELNREEYLRLCRAAEQLGKIRLSLMLQAICATGIRVSELSFLTAEAVYKGEVTVRCKNKGRRIFLVRPLQKRLLSYLRSRHITSGPVFRTRTGAPLHRSQIWREMKALCTAARVMPTKVFPHNLRHLFALTFYRKNNDLALLADLLGHSSINTTRIYLISSGAEHRRRMEQLHLLL